MPQLKDIAHTFTGQTFRSRVEDDPLGECSVIQVKDLSADYNKLEHSPHRMSLNNVSDGQILRKKDILMLTKNNKNRALLYEATFQKAIAVSVFTIIRITNSDISPAYLTWYLNSKTAQDYFASNRVGTYTQNLPKNSLELLEIPVPPKMRQEAIVQLIEQYEAYKEIQLEYESNINLLIDTILKKQLNNQ